MATDRVIVRMQDEEFRLAFVWGQRAPDEYPNGIDVGAGSLFIRYGPERAKGRMWVKEGDGPTGAWRKL